MTWRKGEFRIVQRCNQCNALDATYYAGTGEYLCEECEEFARTLVATAQALEETNTDSD